MRIHSFRHVPFENLGIIEKWAASKGHQRTVTHFYKNESPPLPEQYDLLIVMGGPMNIYEEEAYPWLADEKKAIKAAIAAEKTVLGICLGAQLIADALGAKVRRNEEKEIGWFPISKTKEATASPLFNDFPEETLVLHWHGDTFELPANVIPIASSRACANQGFVYNSRVVALQFHLEMTKETVERLIRNCGHELVEAPFIQKGEELVKEDQRFGKSNALMYKLLDLLEGLPRVP